jgi:predicted O-methyltransferase YrrM
MASSDLSKAARLAGQLIKLPFVNPRGLREVAGVALSAAESVADPEVDVLPIAAVTIEELVAQEKETLPLQIHGFPQERFSIALIEAVGLAVLMRKARARHVFEFGTHRGVSTTQLAGNLPDGGKILTLDLPRNDRRTQSEIDNPGDVEVSRFPKKADLIPDMLRKRIQFLEQDSALFDPSPYRGSMDFVFVDAAHTAEYVKNDSEKGWAMLREGGIMAWHDCRPLSPDVVRYLRACTYQPRRIVGTTLAFAIKPEAAR